MIKLVGKGVCGAIAIGTASVYQRRGTMVYRYTATDPKEEKERFARAKKRALESLREIYQKALAEIGDANAQIFEIHMMMIEDEDYNESILNMIETQRVNAEFAVAQTGENFSQMFAAMDDGYMQARAIDVRDISGRIVTCFSEKEGNSSPEEGHVILCADDLAPSETVSLDKERVLAFVTEQGSQNSHTAILARNLGIPAVVGVKNLLHHVKDGAQMAVDGYTGEVILSPDEETLARMKKKQADDLQKKALLQALRGKENVTLDGTRIHVFANIGGVEQIGSVLYHDAGGIGLFRSEFLYLERESAPSEDDQFFAYKKILESMGEKKVIIRTLDIGADKQVPYLGLATEENPALGVRGIRLSLTHPTLFKAQMKALYRASIFGNLGIMFPMITGENEVRALLSLCDEVKRELDDAQISYSRKIEHGVMIETPAAAVMSDRIAPLVDFFSIGTNDLTQYTLACDRQNASVEPFCDPHHESVLRLIEFTAKSAHRHGAWVGICGELASDLSLTERFLRMGIDELSVSPSNVLRLRDRIRKLDLSRT